MIGGWITTFICAGICLALVCVAVSARAQSDAGATTEANPAIDAVDASVHPEVDGQPHEPTAEEGSRERTTASHAAKRPPASVAWPAHADISTTSTDDKGSPPRVGLSSFRPERESEQPSGSQPKAYDTSGSTKNRNKNDNSGLGQKTFLDAPPYHPLSGNPKPSSIRRTILPAVPDSDQTPALGTTFGRPALGLTTRSSLFPKRDRFKHEKQNSRKRYTARATKPVIPNLTKSSSSVRLSDRHTALALSSK
jgi:hypothetical protein